MGKRKTEAEIIASIEADLEARKKKQAEKKAASQAKLVAERKKLVEKQAKIDIVIQAIDEQLNEGSSDDAAAG